MRPAMVEISFEGTPAFTYPGGTVSGTLRFVADSPVRGRDLRLSLVGQEYSQTHVRQGKNNVEIHQTVPILDLAYDVTQHLGFVDPDHVAPGTYEIPFQFAVPADATPSIFSSAEPRSPGHLLGNPDGLFVEYNLEARLDVPLWLDKVVRSPVPVYSTRRVLGAVPRMISQPNPGRPSLDIAPLGAGPILPGEPFQAAYQVQDPDGKTLRGLTFSLTRLIEYRVNGVGRSASSPAYSVRVPLGSSDPVRAGTFELTVPNSATSTGPGQGNLFRTYWLATADLDVAWGTNVVVEAPLVPA